MIVHDGFLVEKARIEGEMFLTTFTEIAKHFLSSTVGDDIFSRYTVRAFVFLHMPHVAPVCAGISIERTQITNRI